MGRNRTTKLDETVLCTLLQRPEVTHACYGGVGHFRGATTIKMQNGTPGQVVVHVCEPGRMQKVHVYTKDCATTMAAMREFARANLFRVHG